MPVDSDMITKPEGVSCLMVTLPVPGRLEFAKRSITDFCRQTYPNKMLIVVMNKGVVAIQQALQEYVSGLDRRDINVIVAPANHNLGELRNVSLEAANDDIICQWDDDDMHHPERLEQQITALITSDLEAVYLQDVMQYLPAEQLLYWTNWRATPLAGHPGTLMARKSAGICYPTQGPNARMGEDSAVAQNLIARGRVGYLANAAHLYVYVSHGSNTWNAAHHRMLRDELAISRALVLRREALIREGLRAHNFPADRVGVSGNNGLAFTL
ncbi:hypothetical protein GCM10007874_39680 [Labrys miyagiensis]|uniref:Glycosyltransferase 2-like domain-containing protein n=2 Tax=Labrys miyagiensis TaxID=346912 RepID=A0ABQ6CKT1_9HYPH|nr:hypothetical protein GCM10007874_39680 [Labrys miyagiensis]